MGLHYQHPIPDNTYLETTDTNFSLQNVIIFYNIHYILVKSAIITADINIVTSLFILADICKDKVNMHMLEKVLGTI